MKKQTLALICVGLALISTNLTGGDEGMWLFNLPPKEVLKARYGFDADARWLAHLELSSVRFGGASGSFVSPSGLVITNHHVGRAIIQNLSTSDRDLMKTGFFARTRAEEIMCPGTEIQVLRDIEDVTAGVLKAATPLMTAAESAAAREKAIADLEKDSSEKSGLKCTVVNLYSGGMYHLYKYKVYSDVRLVFAPEYMVAKFGGDPDNFCFPRYALDICFFRVYENDAPLRPSHFLSWGSKDLKEGDLVFVSGNPGSTGRLLTCSQLEFLRDVSYPFLVRTYQRRRALLQAYGSRGREEARVALAPLLAIENSLKAYTGYLSGLVDEKLMKRKAQDEKRLRQAVEKDRVLNPLCGKAWDEIARAQANYASFFEAYQDFEKGLAFNSVYFTYARTIVRLSQEARKPNRERLKEFREANIASLTSNLLSPAPIDDGFEIVKLAGSLTAFMEGTARVADIPEIMRTRSPDETAKDLIMKTRLKDPGERKKYIDQGWDAVQRSTDPMIKLALLVDPRSRELRARYEDEVEAAEVMNGALVARALFKLKGTSIPPDATSTPRFSFGVVKGYVENGTRIPFLTTFTGLYERSDKFGGNPPFELPPSFKEKKYALRLDTPLDFVATCDSIGGNSGSPVVNRAGEFVGILFDGNLQSLPARFVYEDEINRSVMVHFQGIVEALRNVYDARSLLAELLGAK